MELEPRCWGCGQPLSGCICNDDPVPMDRFDPKVWQRAAQIWPEYGGQMPSCGATDAGKLGGGSDTPSTKLIG
ncbi:hypothetical protein GF362_06545 [Candidatus Dojkabacteria bacterium]|nr:hypothetical protein [Candidatus Dojkabacteria bacterium]